MIRPLALELDHEGQVFSWLLLSVGGAFCAPEQELSRLLKASRLFESALDKCEGKTGSACVVW